MAQKELKSIKFPGLEDVYKIPAGGGGSGTVTEADIENALGYKPIGADDVPVKKVNGATGDVKSTFYVTITSAEDESISADKTLEEIYTAYEKGYAVYAKTATSPQIIVPLTIAVHSGNNYAVVFNGAVTFGDTTEYAISNDGSGWTIYAKDIAFKDNIPTIPTALKNPNALNIKIGDTTTSYDGSAEKTVEIPEGGGTDESLGITGAAAEQFPKIKAVDVNGKPTAWEPVTGEEVTLGSGDEWIKVAEKTLTEIANEIRLNFDPCKAVYIEFQYGAVENDLGVIGIYPNPKTPVYTAENRAAAITQTTSATNKRGYIFCTIDCRKGTQWVATSQTFFRGDGTFGSIEPGATMNCDIFVFNNNTWASLLWKQQMANADHINSVSAFGAGMNIGTTLTVWGIKA